MKKTPLKKISKKRQNRLSLNSEKDIFKEIREERDHVCQICWKYIYEWRAWCFAHMLSKGMYPKYRLNKDNILLCCNIFCHYEVDRLVTWNKRQIEESLEKWNKINIREL